VVNKSTNHYLRFCRDSIATVLAATIRMAEANVPRRQINVPVIAPYSSGRRR
jgi:hypothetical protein